MVASTSAIVRLPQEFHFMRFADPAGRTREPKYERNLRSRVAAFDGFRRGLRWRQTKADCLTVLFR
jgi:hypothetical protein